MMLLVNVDQRFSAMQVLEHPWVNVSDLLPFPRLTPNSPLKNCLQIS
jgi:hypothetical protein